jgi:hypothetical protein
MRQHEDHAHHLEADRRDGEEVPCQYVTSDAREADANGLAVQSIQKLV